MHLLREADLAYLNHRSYVGVLGDVALQDVRIGEEGIGECLNGLAAEITDREKWRLLIWSSAKHADLDGDCLDGTAEQAYGQRHVGVEVVVHVEAAVGSAGVEDGNLDHVSYDTTPGTSGQSAGGRSGAESVAQGSLGRELFAL